MSLLNPINKSLCLEQLCTANFQKLSRLLPDLDSIGRSAVGIAPNRSHLYLNVLERSPYTVTIELSHRFIRPEDQQILPAIIIRIYLDAKMAEVLSDHAHKAIPQVFEHFGFSQAIMDYKWRLNYFLQKWLEHCLSQGYLFSAANTKTNAAA